MGEGLDRETVARRLKAARALRGWTNADDFKAFLREEDYNVSALAYDEYETGKRALGRGDRGRLTDALEMPAYWFTAPTAELFAEAEKVQQLLGVVYAMLEAFVPEEEAARLYERLVQEVFGDEPGTGESDSSATS